jgi:hypothetical protein
MSREELAGMFDADKERTTYSPRPGLRIGMWLGLALAISGSSAVSGGDMAAPQTIPPGQLTATVGEHLQGPDGSDAGRLWDVLVDSSGRPRAAVIEYGGFAGMGRRKVAVAWTALRFNPADQQHPIALLLNKTQMGRIPDFKTATGPITLGGPASTGNAGTGN